MSLASCSYQCGYIGEGETFTVSILGSTGDLVQRYTGTSASPGTVTPDWSGNALGSGPILRVILMESDPNVSQADLASLVIDSETSYWIDGQKLEFNAQGISIDSNSGGATGYAGCFRKLTAAAGTNHIAGAPFGGLEIRNNLVTPTGGKTVNIAVKLAISTGSKGIHKQGTTNIRIIKANGSSSFATIYCDSTQSFVLDENNDSVTCRVRCWEGEAELATTYKKWYMMEAGQWVQKATSDTFAVDRAMVATFADVKVECFSDSARTKLVASDVQTINDSSDSYIVNPSPNPPDGTFYQGGNTGVTFTPTLTDNDGNPVTQTHKFTYAVMDSVGNVVQNVTTANAIPSGGSFTVPASVANNMHEGPIVNIEAISV